MPALAIHEEFAYFYVTIPNIHDVIYIFSVHIDGAQELVARQIHAMLQTVYIDQRHTCIHTYIHGQVNPPWHSPGPAHGLQPGSTSTLLD